MAKSHTAADVEKAETESSETALEVFLRIAGDQFTMVKPSGKAVVIGGARPFKK